MTKSVNRIDLIDAVCEEYAPELLGFSNSSDGNPTPTSEPFTSEFILEEIEAYLKDDSISPEIDHADCNPEEDILTEAKSSIEEPPELELKDLPSHLEYTFLEENDKLPVIIVKERPGNNTFVANEENELILTRLVTGWRVCIDYRKLNEATQKDHFPLPFMDQMIERLAGNEFYCFLDGFSGYFQIPIASQDQEKTPFTMPLELSRPGMPFWLVEGIVLGHKISKSRIEADRAKVDVITKLPHPTTVKGVRSFLGLLKDADEAPIVVVRIGTYRSRTMCDARISRLNLILPSVIKKGSENLAADHLSRLENPHKDVLENKDINEHFPLETLGVISIESTPWFADY
ncbi:hypothetical protein Tco_1354334, partial [Tanacetum coccineum]